MVAVKLGIVTAKSRVGCTLCHAHVGGDSERIVCKPLRDIDRRSFGIILSGFGVIDARHVVAAVAAGREIDAGREREIRIGFRILRVSPSNLEIFRKTIVAQSFVAQLRYPDKRHRSCRSIYNVSYIVKWLSTHEPLV